MTEKRSIVRSLRHRNFRLFFGGQLVSLVGTWMQSVAQAWLVYRLTGSSLLLGAIGFANQVPVLLVAPFGGAAADRLPRRKILLATQTAAMLLAFGLGLDALSGHLHVAHIFFFSAALGVVNAFDVPTRQSFVIEMVGEEDLVNAIALNSSMVNGARLVGPAVAGYVVAAVGEGWCFVGNGVSYLAVIAGLFAMRIAPRAPRRARASAVEEAVEGFRFVAKNPPIRALLLLMGFVGLTAMPYAVLMPLFADKVLHGGASQLGTLMAASGLGALVGAMALAARQRVQGLGGWVAGGCIGFGVALVFFSFSRTPLLSAALLVPAGAAMMVQMAGSNTLIQRLVPDAMRGRVMALYTMMFFGTAPFGAILAGAIAERVGPTLTVALGGTGCAIAGLVFTLRLPALRSAARLVLGQPMLAGEPAQGVVGSIPPPPEDDNAGED